MTTDFFIRLILATHKVAGILQKEDPLRTQVQDSANKLLASLVLLAEETSFMPEQKRTVIPKAIREVGELTAYLSYAKRVAKINPENFVMLEREYGRVGDFLRDLHEKAVVVSKPAVTVAQEQIIPKKNLQPVSVIDTKENTSASKEDLSSRQSRILELMRNKPKVQVWELQKVLPEVTKRTLRRDLDDLLQRSFITRQGEWNEVFYQIR